MKMLTVAAVAIATAVATALISEQGQVLITNGLLGGLYAIGLIAMRD